jgi:hypothetical protein
MVPEFSAAQILETVASRYASAQNYQDTGEQTTVIVQGPKPWQRRTTRKVFRTAMERPIRFLFEYKEVSVGPESEWQIGAMWRDENGVHAWSYLHPALRGNLTFEMELAALTGVSGGLSSFVTKMFLPEIKCNAVLPEPDSVTLVESGVFDGHECQRLVAPSRRAGGENAVFWFDKTSGLLRGREETSRIDESVRRSHGDAVRGELAKLSRDDPKRPMLEAFLARQESPRTESVTTETTTIWRPRLDEQVDPRAFVFEVPE